MQIQVENIVAELVINKLDLEVVNMNKIEFEYELSFQTTLMMAKKLLDEGIISKREYILFKQRLLEKYQPVLSRYIEVELDK